MLKSVLAVVLMFSLTSCSRTQESGQFVKSKPISNTKGAGTGLETATLAGGCFWCIETIFEDLKGVEKWNRVTPAEESKTQPISRSAGRNRTC